MTTITGTGYSSSTVSFEAGKEAAEIACKNFNRKPDFVLLFCSGKYSPQAVLDGVRSITGNVALIGGAAMGVFTNTNLSYEGFECSVAAIMSDEIQFSTFIQENINENESKAGEELGQKIMAGIGSQPKGLLVFYETSKSAAPPMLNFATPLFAALDACLPKELNVAGSGLLANMQLTHGFQFYNDQVKYQSAVSVLFSGACELRNTIIHGCKPGSSYHTITKAEGPVIFEIDNRPALDVISELMGPHTTVDWKDFPLFVTLGVNKGEKFGAFNETDYANRLCLAVDEAHKAMIMFEPDLKVGDEFQLMHRTVNRDYLEQGLQNLQIQPNEKVLLYFYINCAGRAKPYSGADFEDAEEIRNIIGNKVPFMGFYSGVEVARLQGNLQALDWTGIMCALTKI